MSFWLSVSAKKPKRHLGINATRYNAVHDLASATNDMIARAFDGVSWLRQRFPAKSYVDLRVECQDKICVTDIRTKSFGGPKAIICTVGVPVAWFDDPGDGLLAVRLLRAELLALSAIAERYELGTVSLRTREKDPQKPELVNPFVARPTRGQAHLSAAAAVEKLTQEAHFDEFVVAAVEPAPPAVRSRRQAVVQQLGTPLAEKALQVSQDEGVRVWLIRQDT